MATLEQELDSVRQQYESLNVVLRQSSDKSTAVNAQLTQFDKVLGKATRELEKVVGSLRKINELAGKFGQGGGQGKEGGAKEGSSRRGGGSRKGGGRRGESRNFERFMGGFSAGRGGFLSSISHLRSLRNVEDKRQRRIAQAGVAGGLIGGLLNMALQKAMQGEGILDAHQRARSKTFALSGRRAPRGLVGDGFRLRYKREETQQMLQQMLLANGTIGRKDARSNLEMMRGFGLAPDVLSAMQLTGRQAGDQSGAQSMNKGLAQSLKAGEFPRALAAELAKASTNLVQVLGQSQERVSVRMVTGLVAVLSRRMGGGFAGNAQRTSQLVGRMHGLIKGKQGLERDMMMAKLMQGGMSFFDADQQLHSGANPANIKLLLEVLRDTYGNNTEGKKHAAFRLRKQGFSNPQIRGLLSLDPNQISEKNIQQELSRHKPGISTSAKKAASQMSVAGRKIQRDEALARLGQNADTLLAAKMKLTTTMFDGMGVALKGITGALGKLQGTINTVTSTFTNLKNSITGFVRNSAVGRFFGLAPKTASTANRPSQKKS